MIIGDYVWELFQHTNYGGKSTAAPPGVYGYNWVKDHIGNDVVSSVRSKFNKQANILQWC